MIKLHSSYNYTVQYGIIHIDLWGKPDTSTIGEKTGSHDPEADIKILQSHYKEKTIRFLRQYHSNESIEITPHKKPQDALFWADCDAAWSTSAKLPVLIRTADCIPILFFHKSTPLIGGIHAGWKGLKKEIFTYTINSINEKLQLLEKNDFFFFIAPYNRADTYEVQKDVYSQFKEEFSYPHKNPLKRYLDLGSILKEEIKRNEFQKETIYDLDINNYTHPDYYSHRKNESGRNITLIYYSKL